jgi:hypothetical protein
MPLIGVQTALGRMVLAGADPTDLVDLDLSADERTAMSRLLISPGFRFTRSIQRSWCEARAARGARLPLSILSAATRRRLVGEWVERGGGTNSFFLGEADGFLDFLAQRLPDPSHALSLCRFERAVLRAEEAAASFAPARGVNLDDPTCLLEAGRHAGLVAFFAEPEQLLAALEGEQALPPLSTNEFLVLVAPGLPGLARPADAAELALWRSLDAPATVADLLRRGHARATIESFLISGVTQLACAPRTTISAASLTPASCGCFGQRIESTPTLASHSIRASR